MLFMQCEIISGVTYHWGTSGHEPFIQDGLQWSCSIDKITNLQFNTLRKRPKIKAQIKLIWCLSDITVQQMF